MNVLEQHYYEFECSECGKKTAAVKTYITKMLKCNHCGEMFLEIESGQWDYFNAAKRKPAETTSEESDKNQERSNS